MRFPPEIRLLTSAATEFGQFSKQALSVGASASGIHIPTQDQVPEGGTGMTMRSRFVSHFSCFPSSRMAGSEYLSQSLLYKTVLRRRSFIGVGLVHIQHKNHKESYGY